MKQIWLIILAAFLLAMSLSPHVLAVEICYPVAVEQSEDGERPQMRKDGR